MYRCVCMEISNILVIMAGITLLGIVGISKLAPKYTQNEAKTYQKMSKLDKEYIKKLEDDITYLEDEIKSLNGSLNRSQKGFKVDGKPDQWSEILPDILGNFGEFAPKWLQPFLKNKEIQGALMEKVMANPDKFAGIISKFIGKKDDGQGQPTNQNELL